MQPLDDHLNQRPCHRDLIGDEVVEVSLREAQHVRGLAGGYGGGPGARVENRELAEHMVLSHLGELGRPIVDSDAAAGDEIHGVPHVPLREHGLALVHIHLLETGRQGCEGVIRKLREQIHGAEANGPLVDAGVLVRQGDVPDVHDGCELPGAQEGPVAQGLFLQDARQLGCEARGRHAPLPPEALETITRAQFLEHREQPCPLFVRDEVLHDLQGVRLTLPDAAAVVVPGRHGVALGIQH